MRDNGITEGFLLQRERSGKPIEEPQLNDGMLFYIHAFRHLQTCRPVGMGLAPIPWNVIDRYAARHGLTGEDYEDFVYLINALDDWFLKEHSKNDSKGENKGRIKTSG